MGLFDRWRRKRERKDVVKIKEPEKKKEEVSEADSKVEAEPEDVVGLVTEYERLVQRREELQIERRDLTATLDRGEIDPDEFRKQLMNRIQEAATVSEKLRVTATKLTSLGYRGVLH